MNKIKIIALCGKAGAGKDSVLRLVVKLNPNLHEIISCTTRPPREGEVDGKNYYFLSKENFMDKIANNDMLEYTVFKDWYYGTSYHNLNKEKINIGVFNPAGIELLLADDRIDLTVFYIDALDKTRIIRQLNRENFPDIEEIFRRYKTDKEDFNNLNERFDYKYLLNENSEDLIECARTIQGQML